MQLQINKAKNLEIASKKIDGIVIQPGEVFSLWNLVGKTSKRKGYLEGLTVSDSELGKGRGNLKRRLPTKPPKVLSDRSHDIPTRKRIIPCASPDMQPGTVVYRKKKG